MRIAIVQDAGRRGRLQVGKSRAGCDDAGGARQSVYWATGLLGFIAAVAFATILAVVVGLTLSGAAALSHDLWVHVVRHGASSRTEELRVASVLLGVLAIALGLLFKGQNVAFMVGLAFALAASGKFPALVWILWRGFTTTGAVAAIVTGTLVAAALIWLSPTIQVDILHRDTAWFPLKNPAIVSMPLAFVVAVVVSLAWPEQEAREGYDAKERRMILG